MKIKGSSKKIAPNIMIFIAAVTILITVPLRTYQLVNIIEPKTGFFLKYDVSVYALYILLALSCIVLFIMSYRCSTLPRPELKKDRNLAIAIVSILVAIAFIADFAIQLSSFINIIKNGGSGELTRSMYFVKSGGTAVIIQSVFALLSSIYFILFGISYFIGQKRFETLRLLALSPIVWGLCRIIHRFIEPISFKNVSELLIQLFMIAVMLMFFLAFARIASRVNHTESSWVLYGAGLCTAVLASTDAFSVLIVKIMGKSALLYSKYPLNVVDIFVVIFIFVLLLEAMPTKSQLKLMRDNNIELVEQTADDNDED